MPSATARVLVVFGVLMLLISLALLLTIGSSLNYTAGTFVSGLALLSIVLGNLENRARLREPMKRAVALTFPVGVVVVTSGWTWLNWLYELRWASLPEDAWESDRILQLFRADVIFPAFLFFPIIAVLVGVLRAAPEGKVLSQRIYLMGGMLMIVALLGRVWYGAFAKWFVPTGTGIGEVTAGLLSYPIFLLLSIGGILLGCLPPGVYRHRSDAGFACGYLVGTILYSVGVHLAIWPESSTSVILGTLGFLLVSIPYIVTAVRLIRLKAEVV